MGAQESKASTLYSLKEVSWEYNSKKQNSDGKSGLSFKLYRAIHKPTGKQASVFIYRLRQDDENFGLRLLQNAVKRIKTIRHPGIIKFLHSQIDESTVFVATEPVTPLARVVDALPGEEICLGLFNVLKAVDFLHTQHLCHNNLQIDAVFVADDARRWVLGGMELVDSFTDPCTEHVSRVHACLPEDLIPPEDLDENLRDLAYPKEVKDSFALGQLIGQIIAPFVAPRTVRAKREKDGELFPWPDLQSYADAMASRNPARRPRAKDVLGSSFFADNLFLDIVERFFKEIRGISPEIKRRKLSEPGAEAFYEELFVSRPSYSDDEQGMQVNSEDHRNSRFQPLLSRETYRQYIIPFVSQMLRLLLGLEEEDNELYVGSIRALMLVIPRLAERQRQGVPKTTTSPENPTTPTSETQATKTKFDPPLTDIQQSSEDLLQVEAPAVTTAPPTTKSGSDSLKRRPSSASTHSNKNITLPSNASIVMVPTNAEEPTPRVTIEHLIERNVIPHALSVCVSEDLMDAHRWTVLDRLIEMWKRLCVIEAKKRVGKITSCFSVAFVVRGV
ncbi:Protein-associating with the carboxyl-terminal domain of ezrin [Quaeritorhiza haematococci]|nr:Protein-associating with the carboxyl-terminal domain of ezrin [Quaeritorhiza haematococci]